MRKNEIVSGGVMGLIMAILVLPATVVAAPFGPPYQVITPDLRAKLDRPGIANCKDRGDECSFFLEVEFGSVKHHVLLTKSQVNAAVRRSDNLKECLIAFRKMAADAKEPQVAAAPEWKLQIFMQSGGREFCMRDIVHRTWRRTISAPGKGHEFQVFSAEGRNQILVQAGMSTLVTAVDGGERLVSAKMNPGFEDWLMELDKNTTIKYFYKDRKDASARTVGREVINARAGSFGEKADEVFYFDPVGKNPKPGRLCTARWESDQDGDGLFETSGEFENCREIRRTSTSKDGGRERLEFDPVREDYKPGKLCLTRTFFDSNRNGSWETIMYYKNCEDYDRGWSIGQENKGRAEKALEAKDFTKAITFYEAAHGELVREWGADHNHVCSSLHDIGRSYTAAKKFTKAISIYRRGLALRNCNPYRYSDLALGLLWATAYTENHREIIVRGHEAAERYAAANDREKDQDIEGLLGYGYYRTKQYRESSAHALVAVRMGLEKQDKYCKGEKECQYVNPWHISILGGAWARLGRPGEVLPLFERALKHRSQLPAATTAALELAFAWATFLAADPKKALLVNERLLADPQLKKSALGNQAWYYLALGDSGRAARLIRQAVSAGLKKGDWDEDPELFKRYYPARAGLLPAFLKASGQWR